MTTSRINLTKKNIITIVICAAGLLIFIFGGIVPAGQSINRLKNKVDVLNYRIDEQKNLLPVYKALKEKQLEKQVRRLPFPGKESLLRSEISRIFTDFQKAAKDSGMNVVSIVPEMNSLSVTPGSLLVQTVVRGDFLNFQGFFSGLGAIPFLEHIEEIEATRIKGVTEFKLNIWLALS